MKSLYPFVRVIWNDAHSPGLNQSYTPSEIPHSPMRVETYGFALRQDKIGVTVANELMEDGSYRGLTFVPPSMLVEITPLALLVRKPRVKKTLLASPTPCVETSGSSTPQNT